MGARGAGPPGPPGSASVESLHLEEEIFRMKVAEIPAESKFTHSIRLFQEALSVTGSHEFLYLMHISRKNCFEERHVLRGKQKRGLLLVIHERHL